MTDDGGTGCRHLSSSTVPLSINRGRPDVRQIAHPPTHLVVQPVVLVHEEVVEDGQVRDGPPKGVAARRHHHLPQFPQPVHQRLVLPLVVAVPGGAAAVGGRARRRQGAVVWVMDGECVCMRDVVARKAGKREIHRRGCYGLSLLLRTPILAHALSVQAPSAPTP